MLAQEGEGSLWGLPAAHRGVKSGAAGVRGPLCQGRRGVPGVCRWGLLACCLAWVRPQAWLQTTGYQGGRSVHSVVRYYTTMLHYCASLKPPLTPS